MDKYNLKETNKNLINSNPQIKASTRLFIEKFSQNNQNFNGTLNIVVGCYESIQQTKIFCSNLDFQSLAVINQYFTNLQHLSLIPSDQDSFAEFEFFTPMNMNTKKPIHSSGKLKNFSLNVLNNTVDTPADTFSYQKNHYSFKNTHFARFLAFSFEIGFEGWNSQKDLKTFLPSLNKENEITILEIKNQGNSILKLDIVKESNLLNNQTITNDNSDNNVSNVILRMKINNQIVNNSDPIKLRSIDNLPINGDSAAESIIPKNSKFSVFIEKVEGKGFNVHLFSTNTKSISGEDLISKYFFYENSNLNANLSNSEIKVLSPSVNNLKNFQLSRFVFSNSLGAQIHSLIHDKNSSVYNRCSSDCLLGGFYLKPTDFRQIIESSGNNAQSKNKICWACNGTTVFQSTTGLCEEFCERGTKNLNGNCVSCKNSDCSDALNRMKYSVVVNKKSSSAPEIVIKPSLSHLTFDEKTYFNNFTVSESINGGDFISKPFTTSVNKDTQYGTIILDNKSNGNII